MAKQLTQKQINFCHKYIECGNASEAYRFAYNAENMKPATVTVSASQLLSDHNVTIMIESLRNDAAKEAVITVHDLIKELEEARLAALQAQTVQASAAATATMGKARLLGLDKQIIESTNKHTFEDISDEELDARLRAKGLL